MQSALGRVLLRTCGLRSSFLRTSTRSLCDKVVGEEAEQAWEMSSKTGKSTVTQELWRRREADRLGIGSSHAVAYRFSTSMPLRDEYVGNTGKVLVGRLLEDLDALAGNVAFDWCSDTLDTDGNPPLLVTAAVDRIKVARPLLISEDLYLTGRVIWTGSSSMLVRMKMRAGRHAGVGEQLLTADFVYVALDKRTKKTAKVHQWEPETAEDKELFAHGLQKAAEQKLRRNKVHLAYEMADPATVMAMVAQGDALAELPAAHRSQAKVLMARTGLENTVLTKPQHKNTAGNVFGGYLMRECYELAFTTCFAFLGKHPTFKEIMEFVFDKPVPSGSLLRLRSRIVYTTANHACVEVSCMVIQPETCNVFRANKILVVFDTGQDTPQIVPHMIMEAQAQAWAKGQYEESYGKQATA